MTPGLVTVGYLHPGEWSACFGRSLVDLIVADVCGRQRIVSHPHGEMGLETHAAKLVEARNDIARTVVEDSTAEWLFTVDSDMGFAPDTVERLIASADPSERPVVGGLAFAHKSDGKGPFHARRYRAQPTLYRFYGDDTDLGVVPMFDYPRDSLVEVDATGAACTLIHRTVLEAIDGHWYDPITLPTGAGDIRTFGEDLSFCLRVKAAGYPIWVDTSVKTTHDKGGVFLDEEFFDQQQASRVEVFV